LTNQTVVKAMVLLAVYGTALAIGMLVYESCRYNNVSKITVSKLADLDEVFEVGPSSLRVRNPEFLKVCFTGDYVHALKDAKQWFAADEAEFAPALEAAGGSADTYNGEGQASIVLLSHTSALILQLDRRTELFAANLGCASTDAGDIAIKRYRTNSSTEFYLPNATLKSPRGPGQPRVTPCAEKLERFVESIDDLLAKDVLADEHYWAAIRKYLPATGCRIDEVISISKTSRFSASPFQGHTSYQISFRNADIIILLGLEKDTGSISYRAVSSTDTSS
jgi:hypothetical protein